MWQLRARSRVPIRFFPVRDILLSLLRDVMSCAAQQRPLAVTLQELQRICDTLPHIIINPPRMSWRRLFGVYTVRCRSWNRLQHRNAGSKELNDAAGVTHSAAAAAVLLLTWTCYRRPLGDHERFYLSLHQETSGDAAQCNRPVYHHIND